MMEDPASLRTANLVGEKLVVRQAGQQAIRRFLQAHTCFSLLRASGKIVVFDTRIPLQLAFYALVEHDMLAAPLWDPQTCQFTGLLTVTDFIDILLHYRQTNKDVSNLAVQSIHQILQDVPIECQKFRGLDSDCSLLTACQQLLQLRDDFLPVILAQDMRVLACVTYTNILEHLVTHFREQRRLFDESIHELGIGTYGHGLVHVTRQQSLADALTLMREHGLGALPVLDEARKVVGVYSRSDISFLTKATDAPDAVRNLSSPLGEILANARTDVTTPDALFTCSPSHTLQAIFESFAQTRFNRLYVVDEEERLVGVVSARDLVEYFLHES